LSKRLLISGSERDSPDTHEEPATTYCFGRLSPISVIAHLDHETGNGSRVKHVEEENQWPSVDLSFFRSVINVIYAAALSCIVMKYDL